jgi:hypothetical protein
MADSGYYVGANSEFDNNERWCGGDQQNNDAAPSVR